jgi:hypothetical protein
MFTSIGLATCDACNYQKKQERLIKERNQTVHIVRKQHAHPCLISQVLCCIYIWSGTLKREITGTLAAASAHSKGNQMRAGAVNYTQGFALGGCQKSWCKSYEFLLLLLVMSCRRSSPLRFRVSSGCMGCSVAGVVVPDKLQPRAAFLDYQYNIHIWCVKCVCMCP